MLKSTSLRFVSGCLLLATLLVASPPARSTADQPDDTPAAVSARPSLTSMNDEEAARLSPMLQEIRALLMAERDRVESLTEQLSGTLSHDRSLALQHEISSVKERTEIQVLEVQARYAEAEGRIEQAREIRGAVEILEKRAEQRREKMRTRS